MTATAEPTVEPVLEDDFSALFGEVEVVDAESIRPASYNPRQVFAERLNLVKLSLGKFGFLLPIYIDADGEILSGHQRHHVATEMLGATRLPVVRTRRLTGAQARSLNLLFNRATNDLPLVASSEPLAQALLNSDVPERVAALPDIDVNSRAFMPVLDAKDLDVATILDANPVWTDQHGIKMAEAVVRLGQTDIMPIVTTPSGKIVNGRARAAVAGKQGRPTIKVVEIAEDKADLASSLLNLLSMRYEVEGALADDLRANAFRAAPSVRHTMSVNGTHDLTRGKSPSGFFDHTKPEHAAAWLKHYGPNTLDFGAGNYWDAKHAAEMGANAAAFEPYYAWDRDQAREMAEEWFFSRISDGREFDSIFLSNVMNTVPFDEDRKKVITIVSALASDRTRLFASGRHINGASGSARQRSDKRTMDTAASAIHLDQEPGLVVTSVSFKPAIQKFHSVDEFADLWRHGFRRVEASGNGGHVFAVCWKPKPVDPVALREAIEFEFNLPWDDGQRFGMHERALDVFSERLGIDLRAARKSRRK